MTDHARLAALHAEAFAPERGWTAAEIASLAETGLLIEAAEGFALFSLAADEAELLTLAIAPARRREGAARRLLAEGEARLHAAGAHKIFLEVAEDNVPARALYAAAGFTEAARRPRYYLRPDGDRVDALILNKPLP